MNVSTRLKIAGIFAAAIVAIVSGVLMMTTQQVKQELVKNEIAGEVFNAITGIRYLTLEYVLRHEARSYSQWTLRHASLAHLLANTTEFRSTSDQEIIEDLVATNKNIKALFIRLVETHQDRTVRDDRTIVLEELEARLTGQITNKTQAMISAARKLSEHSRAAVLAAQKRASFAVIAFGTIAVLAIAFTLMLAFESITRPLARLRAGTAVVGEGNLDFRLDIATKDEIGELARAFDTMTEKLKTTTVSRDELGSANKILQAEIVIRQEAEHKVHDQLQRLNLLHQITRAIGERQDLGSIFHVVTKSIEEQLPVDFCCVCSFDAVTNQLTVASVGEKSEPIAVALEMQENSKIAIDENGLSRCVRGELVYEPNGNEILYPFPKRLVSGGLNALVFAPMLVESRVFGILIAARRKSHGFVSGECEFLKHLTEHVALATHQAQLHNALQQAYDDLRQTQQAVMQQERLKALGQMASGIAHDINNAISPVALYVESMLEKDPNLSERSRDYLETIQRAIDDVAQTVARMREFYRSRTPDLNLSPTYLGDLGKQVVDLTRARWYDMPQQRGIAIKLETDFASELPAIAASQSEIREALINLIFNAVDAMPEGGTLTLRTAVTNSSELDDTKISEKVSIEVADTGVGMNESTRTRCLEPFFTTKGERGTGLGLAMVYGVAQRHNAELEIESSLGVGTIMRLSFAVPKSTIEATTKPNIVYSVPRRLRILVVDDDPLLLKSLRDTLELDGHVVYAANGGQAGIEAYKSSLNDNPFAVVITDLGMPSVDGRKVANAIKALSPLTSVILLTGWGQRMVADGEMPENVDHLLSKPPKLYDLRRVLAECCLTTEH